MTVETYAVREGGAYTRCEPGEITAGSASTIVLPAVCVGNVAQLAADLLLCSTPRAEHVGMLRHPLVLPCFGVNPYAARTGVQEVSNADGSEAGGSHRRSDGRSDGRSVTGHAAHPIDLYRLRSGGVRGGGTDVYVLQQRAPASAGCQVAFSTDMMAWIREAGFTRVCVLGSLSAEYRKDKDICRDPAEDVKFVELVGPHRSSLTSTTATVTAKATTLGARCDDMGLSPLGDEYRETEEEMVHMPWALLRAAEAADGLEAVGVLMYVMEGDNRVQGARMAQAVARVIDVDVDVRLAPSSWSALS